MKEILLTQNLLNQTQSTILNGVSIILTVRYLPGPFGGWFASISNASADPVAVLVSSVKMQNFIPILKSPHLLAGYLMPVPLDVAPSELKDGTLNPWGTTHALIYLTENEYAALRP